MSDKKGGHRVERQRESREFSISTKHYMEVITRSISTQSSSGKEQGKNPQKVNTSGCPKKTK